jgi:hypothetical protein
VRTAIFLVTLFVVVQVLLRPHSTSHGPSHAPLVSTVVLFALFGLGSVIFREHFASKRRRQEAGGAGEAGAEEVGVESEEASAGEGTVRAKPACQ